MLLEELHHHEYHDSINTEYILTVALTSNYILKTRTLLVSQELIIVFDWWCWPVSW